MDRSRDSLVPLAAVISAWVVSASAYLWFANPSRPWPFLLAIAIVGAAWGFRHQQSTAAMTDQSLRARKKLTQAIVLAGLILGLALGVALMGQQGWQWGAPGEFDERIRGIIMGVIVIAFSSGIPKQASSAATLAMRRIVGWSLVLAGLGFALCWLVLPVSFASVAAPIVLFAGLAFGFLRATLYSARYKTDH